MVSSTENAFKHTCLALSHILSSHSCCLAPSSCVLLQDPGVAEWARWPRTSADCRSHIWKHLRQWFSRSNIYAEMTETGAETAWLLTCPVMISCRIWAVELWDCIPVWSPTFHKSFSSSLLRPFRIYHVLTLSSPRSVITLELSLQSLLAPVPFLINVFSFIFQRCDQASMAC